MPGCTDSAIRLEIIPSTRVRDVVTIGLEKLKTENQLLWIGAGPAVPKVVSSVEVMKKRIKNLHQITQLNYKRVDEYWEPKIEGLDRLQVTREVPAIGILLSKQPLDDSIPGYQAPGSNGEGLWLDKPSSKRKNNKRNKPNRSNDKRSGASDNAQNSTQRPKGEFNEKKYKGRIHHDSNKKETLNPNGGRNKMHSSKASDNSGACGNTEE